MDTDRGRIPVVRKDLEVLLLAVAGAGLDAVMFLSFQILTAAQTGNTILLATALARGRFDTAAGAVVSVAGYIVGAAIGELAIVGRRSGGGSRAGRRPRPWHPGVFRALLLELVVIACLFGIWIAGGTGVMQAATVLPIALSAVAMGIQGAAVLRLHYGPTTTYITGTLTTFATETVRRLRKFEPEPPARAPKREPGPGAHEPGPAARHRGAGAHRPGAPPWIYGSTWIIYGVGAVISGLVFVRVGELALAVPIAAIAAVIALEARGP